MSRQYNMYNVQLSEFWKQRCGKEAVANTPYGDEDFDDGCSVASEALSRVATSQISTTSSVSRAKVCGAA